MVVFSVLTRVYLWFFLSVGRGGMSFANSE
jgi:hypothetical protein